MSFHLFGFVSLSAKWLLGFQSFLFFPFKSSRILSSNEILARKEYNQELMQSHWVEVRLGTYDPDHFCATLNLTPFCTRQPLRHLCGTYTALKNRPLKPPTGWASRSLWVRNAKMPWSSATLSLFFRTGLAASFFQSPGLNISLFLQHTH